LAKAGRHWVNAYLFAKQDRDNIDDDELAVFKLLAKSYTALNDQQMAQLVQNADLTEICHDDQTQV
jgi:hypothetical protein